MGCTLSSGGDRIPASLDKSQDRIGGGMMVPRDYVDEVISSLFEDAVDPKISVVGVGGAGGQMVRAPYDPEVQGGEALGAKPDPAGPLKGGCVVEILPPPSAGPDP